MHSWHKTCNYSKTWWYIDFRRKYTFFSFPKYNGKRKKRNSLKFVVRIMANPSFLLSPSSFHKIMIVKNPWLKVTSQRKSCFDFRVIAVFLCCCESEILLKRTWRVVTAFVPLFISTSTIPHDFQVRGMSSLNSQLPASGKVYNGTTYIKKDATQRYWPHSLRRLRSLSQCFATL